MWPIREWRAGMVAAGQSPRTIANREWMLRRFAREHPDPWAVTSMQVEAALAAWGGKANYRKSLKSGLHSFYVWAIRNNYTLIDPTLALPSIRAPRARAKPCPEPLVKAAILRADPDTARDERGAVRELRAPSCG